MPSPTYKKTDPYVALRLPEFRLFLTTRFFFIIGIQMISLVVAWQVYDITRDPLALGLTGLAEAIPALSIALIGGYVADRFDRRWIMLVVYAAICVAALALMGISLNREFLYRTHAAWPFYLVMFCIGIGRGFVAPATFAFLSQLVPREHYRNSSAWNSTVWQTAAVIGPAAGGFCYNFIGPVGTYAIAAGFFCVCVVGLCFIGSKPVIQMLTEESFLQKLTGGIRFVFRTQIVLGALVLDLFAVLFGGAVALLPVFADTILHIGPLGLGFLRAAPAFGALITALILAYTPPSRRAGPLLLGAVAGFGLCMVGFGLSHLYLLSLFLLALSGAFDSVSVVIRSTVLQLYTPDEMRGRVSAVNTMFISSSNEIGEFESGVTAKLFGTAPSVVLGGCLTLVVVAAAALWAPQLRRLSLQVTKPEAELVS